MELSSNYITYNTDVAKLVGIEPAIYFQQIYDINKATNYAVSFNVVLNADKIEKNTAIAKDRHEDIINTLVDAELLVYVADNCVSVASDEMIDNFIISDSNSLIQCENEQIEKNDEEIKKRGRKPNKNYEELLPPDVLALEYVDNKKSMGSIALEYDVPTYIISKLIKQYDLTRPTANKGEAKAGVKARLIAMLNSTSEEYISAVSSWIDSVQEKFGCMRTDAFKYSINALDKFTDHNLDVALEVLKIATVNQYRDMNWAINNYTKNVRKPVYTKHTVLDNSANKGLFDAGSEMTLEERKKYLEENQSKKVF